MANFMLVVQTEKDVEEGCHGSVFSEGTKAHCIEMMQKWHQMKETVRAWVVRKKDDEIVAILER